MPIDFCRRRNTSPEQAGRWSRLCIDRARARSCVVPLLAIKRLGSVTASRTCIRRIS